MISPTFQDQRLNASIGILLAGRTKVLALDIFDTLLPRRVPKPTDVFLRVGKQLQQRGLLGVGQTADSFAAIRYQTEYAARNQQQRQHGNREVTLAEIYALVPRHIVHASIKQLVAAETAVEHELCFANPDIVQLARLAEKRDVRLALISNSYHSEAVLQRLVRANAPQLPHPDAWFVSCEHRCGKRDGLMQRLLNHFQLQPEECLLVGDNPVSDRDVAQNLGIPCTYIGNEENQFAARLIEEHPVQWHDRVLHYGEPNGDYGISWLRRQAGYWPAADLVVSEQGFYYYGAQMLGPLLSGFAAWTAARLNEEKAKTVFGIMREGQLLNELVTTLNPKVNGRLLAASRLAASLGSFSPEYPDHLEDFLTRRGHWTLGELMRQLGFHPEQAATLGDPLATLDILSPVNLTRQILASPLAAELYDRSAERRRRLLLHLKQIGALNNKKLYLLDLGYAATIQRALQRIFTIERIPIETHGLYLVSAHVSLATQLAGGVVEGFLAQNGNPNDFARAFCRSPEVVELACMPPQGTVLEYAEDGTPIFGRDHVTDQQQSEVAIVQRGIKDFARAFALLTANSPITSFTSKSWQEQIRAIATRLVVYPTAEEAKRVGHWQADSDLGLASPRPIVSMGPHVEKIGAMTSPQLAGLPRRDVPWLYGVAASIRHDYARQVASLWLRREEPFAFLFDSEAQASLIGPAPVEIGKISPTKQPANVLPLTESERLVALCETAIGSRKISGRFERALWMSVLMQPNVEARRFIYEYLWRRFEELGETQFTAGLRRKLWRIGQRDYTQFKILWALQETDKPGLPQWTFLKEAFFAAILAADADYALMVLNQSHAESYKAYAARMPYTPFQDCLSVAAVQQICTPLRPALSPRQAVANRRLRIGYVLASELGETYSPLTDIACALAATHDPARTEVSVISVHTEENIRQSVRSSRYLDQMLAKGVKLLFSPVPTEDKIATELQQLVAELAPQNFDALIFTTLTGRAFALAALRPAHLMVGLCLGEVDVYTSPLLDFNANLSHFSVMDSSCPSYLVKDFMPPDRFHKPSRPFNKAELGMAPEATVIVSSGRSVKFFSESYWQVVTDVLQQRPQVNLVLMGPTYDEMLEWLPPHLPVNLKSRVHFLGWRDDHAEVLAAADLMLDTFPMGGGYTLTEAMSLGVPAILCRNKTEDFLDLYSEQVWMPIGEIVTESELSLEWDDIDGIRRAVFKLVDDTALRHRLRQKVQEIAAQRMDIKPTAERIEVLIKQHLETRHEPGTRLTQHDKRTA